MDVRFKNENPFLLDTFDETTNIHIQKLPISEYEFDEDTKDFLDQIELHGNEDCSQLVEGFRKKIDLYKIYTKNDDVTEKISLIEILFKAGYTKVATGIAYRGSRQNPEKVKALQNIMVHLLENMQTNDFTPWKVHFIEMFVTLHGTASHSFLLESSDNKEYSVTEKINTRNGEIA